MSWPIIVGARARHRSVLPHARGTDPAAADDDGSVTAEFALGMPSVIAVAAIVVAVWVGGSHRLALEDAARAGAREAARGAAPADVEAAASRSAPGAEVTVAREGDLVTVRARSHPAAVMGWDLPILTGEATARVEEGGDDDDVNGEAGQ
ncbi:TadE family type IV pilus minor pilin [Falsarthrobacter nasiphocae]|uniref:Flp pilus assembly protein TadG n=1 Tax=Falsarthrobacter nasiphocae TaxID=189863 RepID=A0AAE4C5I0_9MICC|nr:TadE family type IV pilus minor pilin [Falsarthrobacter nasiphocae]MDR6892356.1 Flp pilus assembly protein TadG [Falsarthrobacter nasiphocae]